MNKFIILAVLLLSTVLAAETLPFKVRNDLGERFRIIDKATEEGYRRIRVRMDLDSNLSLLETATTICFESDSSFSLSDGAKGFGMTFMCAIHECTSNTHLHTLLFGSQYYNGGYWAGAGIDASHTNIGVHHLEDGTNPDAGFKMEASLAESINLPVLENEVDTHYKCFTNYRGSYVEDNLLVDIHLDGDWESHDIVLPAHVE
ncbi:unnamed protein product [Moneuplotes crassus]|uniref:Uncharacterized protein n=1 Tax=Euplotes crassus TaxID=5936 RepID=A0AAD1XP88_EUPCR|nr:unnamed protein product [Moneuplotes crassus]